MRRAALLLFTALSITAGCARDAPPTLPIPTPPPPSPALSPTAAPPAGPRLGDAERADEAAWLASFKLVVPASGVLLEAPFDPPLTRRSFVVPTSWYRRPRPATVDPQALLRDLGDLEIAFPLVYGGYERAEARGLRFADWFARWRATLESKASASIPVADAFAPMAELMAVQLDNHTGPLVQARFGSGSLSALLAAEPGAPCTRVKTVSGAEIALDPADPAQRAKAVLVPDGKALTLRRAAYLTYPASRGAPAQVQCGDAWIAAAPAEKDGFADRVRAMLSLAGKTDERDDVPAYARLSADVGYLRLPTFSKKNGERLQALATSLPAAAGKERALIVDLRFNDGGDGGTATGVLSRWVDTERMWQAQVSRSEKSSCLVDAMRWGYTQMSMAGMEPGISPALRERLQRSLDSLFAPAEPGCPATTRIIPASWSYRDRRFQPAERKPILMVLVNELCASDCELVAQQLASIPEAVVVGVNTFGVLQFVQPSYTVLPRSRVGFRIARGMSDPYGDGRSVDGYGLDVDVWVRSPAASSKEGLIRLAGALAKRRGL